jgi:hypothetical protein
MSDTIRSKLMVHYKHDQNVIIETKKLEVRQSTSERAGLGVFALEPIPAGTIFLECIDVKNAKSSTIDKKINDLAYKGQCSDYNSAKNIEMDINVGYIIKIPEDLCMLFFGESTPNIYLYALRDIKECEELSRFYGIDYWLEYEFWQRFPNNRYMLTGEMQDLPCDWVFVDQIRREITYNYHLNLFAKKIDNQYHYLVSSSKPNYFDPQFTDKLSNIVTITKDNYSPYKNDEVIYDGMYLTGYLEQKYSSLSNSSKSID